MSSRLLFVDDDNPTLDLMSETLTDMGYEVNQASNGYRALDLMTNSRYDLIVTDLKMPQVDGEQLISYIRANTRNATTPVIIVSGFADPDTFHRLRHLDVHAVLEKPVGMDRLFSTINACLAHGDQVYEYSHEMIQIARAAFACAFESLGCGDVVGQEPFTKRSERRLADLVSTVSLFGRSLFGSLALELPIQLADRQAATAPQYQPLPARRLADELARAAAESIRLQLAEQGYVLEVGIARSDVRSLSEVPHSVAGSILCLPFVVGGWNCAGEVCLRQPGPARDDPKITIFQRS